MGSIKDRNCMDLTEAVFLLVFPVVMCGCESWTVKKVECQRIDAFELWCWRRLLRIPCTARRFIHLVFIFVFRVRECPNFIFLHVAV